jgi:hypothetical protein
MSAPTWVYDDGGRAAAGFKGNNAGDCVCRAIAIATNKPYREVYDALTERTRKFRAHPKNRYSRAVARSIRRRSSAAPRDGVNKMIYRPYLEALGWRWEPVLCGTTWDDLPQEGCFIVLTKRHLATVINGIIHDIYDCTRDGTRCVYGYFQRRAT